MGKYDHKKKKDNNENKKEKRNKRKQEKENKCKLAAIGSKRNISDDTKRQKKKQSVETVITEQRSNPLNPP